MLAFLQETQALFHIQISVNRCSVDLLLVLLEILFVWYIVKVL